MSIELVPAKKGHLEALARICYEAFGGLHDRHAFPRDFPSVEMAAFVMEMLFHQEDVYGVVALQDGRPVGSNFLWMADPVAGVGPITVDPACQGQGVGRLLMEDVLRNARESGRKQVRLVQEAFNTVSLSLYAGLGFEVKAGLACMQAVPSPEEDPAVRDLRARDLPAVEALSSRLYKTSRRNEAALAVPEFCPVVLEREGRIAGYFIPGMLGHGVAETEEDLLALIGAAARRVPAENARFFCPLSEASLFRKALQAGCRAIKTMNLMTLGPYEAPEGAWLPSILY
jgi:GNAT superfamily N-acetyltransferase